LPRRSLRATSRLLKAMRPCWSARPGRRNCCRARWPAALVGSRLTAQSVPSRWPWQVCWCLRLPDKAGRHRPAAPGRAQPVRARLRRHSAHSIQSSGSTTSTSQGSTAATKATRAAMLSPSPWPTSLSLQAAFEHFNEVHPHSSLKMRSPREFRRQQVAGLTKRFIANRRGREYGGNISWSMRENCLHH